jgi:hypothetical protein
MTNDDRPTIYPVDGTVTKDWTIDDWPRPEAGYGSSFTTINDLNEWWGEFFGSSKEAKLFSNWLINKSLVQYESSVSGFVMNYRLYADDSYSLKCAESFSHECWRERMYAAVAEIIESHFETDCLGELNSDAEAAECLAKDVCEAISSFLREEVKETE